MNPHNSYSDLLIESATDFACPPAPIKISFFHLKSPQIYFLRYSLSLFQFFIPILTNDDTILFIHFFTYVHVAININFSI